MKISLSMIVKNEEKVLGRCLDTVKNLVDEIIIVDTGSRDQTKTIAANYTDNVYDFVWIDDFAAARNFAFGYATGDYILWLDADDIIEEKEQDKFLILKQNLDYSVDSITMKYNLSFDPDGNVASSLRRNRLVKKSKNFKWIGAVHEYLAVNGKIIDSDIAIRHKREKHDTYRNIKIYEKRLKRGEAFSPRDKYYYANELKDHGLYSEAIKWYRKFLNSKLGWVEDNIAACRKMADCYFLLDDLENAQRCIFASFSYDSPRAESCCRLGYYLKKRQKYEGAIYWYKLATKLDKPRANLALIDYPSWTWLPHLELCICFDKLGEYELAFEHNELAAQYIPNNPHICANREYFKSIFLGKKDEIIYNK